MDPDVVHELPSYPRLLPEIEPQRCQMDMLTDKRQNPTKYSLVSSVKEFSGNAKFIGMKRRVAAARDDEEEKKESVASDVEMEDSEENEPLYNAQNFTDDAEFLDEEDDEEAHVAPNQNQNSRGVWDPFGNVGEGRGASAAAGSAAAAGAGGRSYVNDLTSDDWAAVAAGN